MAIPGILVALGLSVSYRKVLVNGYIAFSHNLRLVGC